MLNVNDLLKLTDLINRFQLVRRQVLVRGEERPENSVEHSYQLALTAWYLITTEKLDLDLPKCLKYALAHDLVEVYAGDTWTHHNDPAFVASKPQREQAAARRLRQEFPEFLELHEVIEGYEARADKESLFIYALDKLLPPLNVYLDGGRSWHVHNITLEMVKESKVAKVSVWPEVKRLYDELMILFTDKQGELFPKNK
ncbi:MAG: hypothetical protein A3J48_01375 [Candidatus Doudnabacteria bacterium RIFCSPHIGHO2_02_FULL_46_11]|uniref:HD domain-containing protein n=1 Tax=Candidatus Doudnabacteria bacterium RIFCSPHIGHO2_02_FULL_46_11 TaxID=1817832 RepID=A0A1F5P8Z0_9BACT|nr:MAG: hypothetical protein A3J48_01375 [Candidatus Doudnabacteria bacterium RIFCSPHIGHO2_02_FULL_46_11]